MTPQPAPVILFGGGPRGPTGGPATGAAPRGPDDLTPPAGRAGAGGPRRGARPPRPGGGGGAGLTPPGPPRDLARAGTGGGAAPRLDVGVRIRSGMVTDTLVDLDRRGLLLDRAEATYAWGGDGLAALSAGGRLRLVP